MKNQQIKNGIKFMKVETLKLTFSLFFPGEKLNKVKLNLRFLLLLFLPAQPGFISPILFYLIKNKMNRP